MKKLTKILSLILSATLLLSTAAACKDKKEVELPSNLAEYLDSGKEFQYFGYSSIRGSKYTDGTTQYDIGYSMINEYYINQFYDAGMEILQPQAAAPSNDSHHDVPGYHDASTLKYVLDTAHALGKDQSVLITDNSFYMDYARAKSYADTNKITDHTKISLIKEEGPRDFEGQYYSTDELDARVEHWLSTYCSHPAFAGIMLQDEPPAKMLRVLGQLYQSVRRVEKKLKAAGKLHVDEIMINLNLLPYYPGLVSSFPAVETSFHADKEQREHEAYRRYMQVCLEETQAKNLQIDIYPMLDNGIYRMYVLNLQIAAEEAKKHGSKLVIVSQSTTYNNDRIMSMEDLTYLNNILMGFGCENIGYYTYFTADDGGTYDFNDWGSFVTRFGDTTDLYYRIQRINAMGQTFAPVVLNFDYQTSKGYIIANEETPLTGYAEHMQKLDSYENKANQDFKKLTKFELNKEMAIVTELYDEDKDNYMYMFMNSADPKGAGSNLYETATATFSKEYNALWIWKDGEYFIQELDKKKSFTFNMKPGEAYFAIPFKA